MDGDLYGIPRGAGLINPNPVVHAKPTPTSATVFLPKDYNNSKHGYRIDALEIFDMIRTIKDPEHPHTLEELNVITEDDVQVIYLDDDDDGDDIQVDEPSINSNSNSNIDNSNSNEIDEKQNNNNKVKNNIRNYRPLTKLQKAQLSRLLGSSSSPTSTSVGLIRIGFTPTVEHCSLATHIGLCLRQKLMNELPNANDFKVDIYVYENMHKLANDITKQINDKERVAAAMENQQLRALIDECIKEPDYS